MGSAKEQMMRRQDDYEWARGYLCDLGVLRQCEAHEDYYDGSEDLDAAYKRSNADITAGRLELRKGQTRRDITDLLKSVYEDNSGVTKCPSCEKNMRG